MKLSWEHAWRKHWLNSCSMKGLKKGMPIYPALTGRGARIRSSMSFLGTQGLRPAWAIWDFASRNKNQDVTQEYPRRKMNKGFGLHVTKEWWKVTDWDRNQFHSYSKKWQPGYGNWTPSSATSICAPTQWAILPVPGNCVSSICECYYFLETQPCYQQKTCVFLSWGRKTLRLSSNDCI